MDLVLGLHQLEVPFSFSIPTHNRLGNEIKRIGLFTSGGIDSSALLCLIMSELKATNRLDTIPVVALTIVKGEGSTFYASRVVEQVSKHFGVKIEHQNNIPNNEPAYSFGRISRVSIEDVYENNKYDMDIYQANNRMAPDDIRPFSQTLKIFYPDEQVLYKAPFLNLHKPQIMDLYYKLGCEDIIPYTHSCTVLALGKCNKCYSCKEREWGFDALGRYYIDTIPPEIEDISYGGTWANPAFPVPETTVYPENKI